MILCASVNSDGALTRHQVKEVIGGFRIAKSLMVALISLRT
jgi:hypothetical protein